MKNSNANNQKNKLSDAIDSVEDKAKMKEEITEISLPDVDNVPGQEKAEPLPSEKQGEITLSSKDEEGDNVLDSNANKPISNDADSNVSDRERNDLFTTANDMPGDDEKLREAALDNTDEDGTPLNEDSFKKNISAYDLDVPGANQDDANEAIGEEDEENNEYSLGGDDNEDAPRDAF